jgi:hypothetical protein
MNLYRMLKDRAAHGKTVITEDARQLIEARRR